MPRHSKNNTANAFHSRHEFKEAGYGSKKARLGKDAQMPFGHCALSLAPAVDPVASPSGDIYCRECIYKYLLDQKRKLKRARQRYEEQVAELQDEQAEAKRAEADKRLQEFISANNDTSSADVFRAKSALETADERKSNDRLAKLDEEAKNKEAMGQLQRRFIARSEVNTKEELKRTSFWVPQSQPTAAAAKLKKPDKAPRDPMHPNKFLKLKHLIKVNFRVDPEAKLGAAAKAGTFICAVTRKPITHQKAVLLRPSGEVILESCLKTVVLPTMRCPITNKRLKKHDIVHLTAGGTSFSAHNKVVAVKYTPTM